MAKRTKPAGKSEPEQERRPAFAAEFPRTPELDALVSAFDRGDFGHVRKEAPRLAASAEDESVKAAALVLASRVEADPLATWILGVTGLVLVFLSVWWVLHSHR